MKVIAPLQSGRLRDVVFVNTRWGQVKRQYTPPRNPRTTAQQRNRAGFAACASRWRGLSADARYAWALAGAKRHRTTADGRRVALSGYAFYMSINAKRAFLGLPSFDLPPAEPSFTPNPVAELVATNDGSKITLKVRVPTQPAQYTVLQGAAGVSAGVSCVQHFPTLGLLPEAVDGWADVTALYEQRHGIPIVGTVVFLRTFQHIDGYTDVPKLVSVLIPAAAG
jgi:hypothetical protein